VLSFTAYAYVDSTYIRSEKNDIEARRVFKDASQRKGIDWPVAIWDRWITFEYQFGSLEDIEKATNAVKEFKRKEDERRFKHWQATYSTVGPIVATTTLAIDQPPTNSDQL
jgi:hypothetical protein